jgi:hypothetical protein
LKPIHQKIFKFNETKFIKQREIKLVALVAQGKGVARRRITISIEK